MKERIVFASSSGRREPCCTTPSFQHLLLKLIGSKEEVKVAKEIQKALKQSPPTYLPGNSVISGGPSRPFRLKFVFRVAVVAITLDLVGLSGAHTTVSTVNESLFVVNKKKTCGLHVVSMYLRFPFFPFHSFSLSTGLTVFRRVI